MVVVLVIFETYLRVTGYYPKKVGIPPYLYTNHPTTWWTLRPRYNRTVLGADGFVTYTFNSQGIRAPLDFSRDLTTSRIFIIGDSYTFGLGVNEEVTFSRVLQDMLQTQAIDMGIINLGVAGFGTFHCYERLREYAELLGIPKIVVYVFCPNDPVDNIAGKKEVVYGIRIDAHRKYKPLLAVIGHGYHQFRSLAFVLDRLYDKRFNPRKQKRQELNRQVIDVNDREDFLSTKKYLSEMITWTSQYKVHFLVVTTSSSQYSKPIKKFLDESGISMIKANDIFTRLNTDNRELHLIEGHWNQYGHRLMAQGIFEHISQHGWITYTIPKQ